MLAAATEAGFGGLRGHVSLGGLRASIYNSLEEESVDALIEFLDKKVLMT